MVPDGYLSFKHLVVRALRVFTAEPGL